MNDIQIPPGAKVISLWQPRASLVALGEKQYETRSWSTSYRGPLVIHAAKKWDAEIRFYLCLNGVIEAFYRRGIDSKALPRGAALCVVDLVDVVTTWDAVKKHKISSKEQAFGDYGPGRYAWKLENVRVFPQPIPMRGQQGLWKWVQP